MKLENNSESFTEEVNTISNRQMIGHGPRARTCEAGEERAAYSCYNVSDNNKRKYEQIKCMKATVDYFQKTACPQFFFFHFV